MKTKNQKKFEQLYDDVMQFLSDRSEELGLKETEGALMEKINDKFCAGEYLDMDENGYERVRAVAEVRKQSVKACLLEAVKDWLDMNEAPDAPDVWHDIGFHVGEIRYDNKLRALQLGANCGI